MTDPEFPIPKKKQSQPGSGLGLAIVRDIVKDHEAVIEVCSGANGRGTVFTIRFPI
jgi:two-component system sensor histidine kinase TctE